MILAVLLCLFALTTTEATDLPAVNILFILTDDQRWDSLGCYGNKVVKTPNLDKLAAEGARMDSFYVAAPLCCPSRATFLTGLYPHQSGIIANGTANNRPDLAPETITVAEYLNQAGYVTGFVGKAHLGGDPTKWGFKKCPVYLTDGESRYENPRLVKDGKAKFHPGEITSIFADAAMDFIEDNQKKTWLLWLATTATHKPYVRDKKFSYKLSDIVAPPGWPPSQPFKPSEVWVDFYSTVSVLDYEVGRVLRKIDELGLREKTFVFVVSDNGFMFGSHKIKTKNTWFDESSRVPAIARWPGKIKSGSKISSLFSSVDWLPTLLQLVSARPTKELEGVSMLPGLTGGDPLRTEAFSEMNGDTVLVRKAEWKYVKHRSRKEFLYNLKEDPFEEKDLSQDPKHASLIEQLKQAIDIWLKRTPVLSESTNTKQK